MSVKSILLNKAIPLSVIEPEVLHIVLDVVPVCGYDSNGAKTDVIVGYTYVVVNARSFNQYRVKIERPVPLITRESLLAMRERGERLTVEFENPTVKMYWSSYQNAYADSIKADDVHLVEDELQL